MKNLLVFILFSSLAFAAIPSTAIWEVESGATAGNVNGGGFDPSATSGMADLACSNANTATAVCTSAIYPFVSASDTNAWIYIQSGTNWTTSLWCKIASVDGSHNATIDATAGHCVLKDAATLKLRPTTVAGLASVASPTAGTFLVDYSQQATARLALTDVASAASSTTMTSASALFTPAMVGNVIHITTTGSGYCSIGYYEIIAYASSSSVTTDRTTNSGTPCATGTGRVGGAISLGTATANLTDTIFFGTPAASSTIYMSGSFTLTTSGIGAGTAGAAQAPTSVIGYGIYRGDSVLAAVNTSTSGFALAANWDVYNLAVANAGSSTSAVLTPGTAGKVVNCKIVQTATAAGRIAVSLGGSGGNFIENSEIISYKGIGLNTNTNSVTVVGSYIHGSDTGISATTGALVLLNDILEDNATANVSITGAAISKPLFLNNTFYGSANKAGVTSALALATGVTDVRAMNNIFYGFPSAVSATDTDNVFFSDYNDFYNNTTDVSAATQWQKGAHDLAIDPAFSGVSQLVNAGTVTSSTNVLTDSGANFTTGNITANLDEINITAITGTGAVTGHYLITAINSSTSLALSSNLTSSGSGSAITYSITHGHNFSIGTNLNAKGFPGMFPGGLTTGYMSIGAAQRNGIGSPSVTVAY